jgi:hypothetical protein
MDFIQIGSISLYLVYVIKSNYSVKSAVQIIEEVHNLKRKHKKLGDYKTSLRAQTVLARLQNKTICKFSYYSSKSI